MKKYLSTRYLYHFISSLGIFAVAMLRHAGVIHAEGPGLYLAFGLLLGYLAAVYIGVRLYNSRRENRLLRILNEECDPLRYARAMEKRAETAGDKDRPIYLMNAAGALIDAGLYGEAQRTMNDAVAAEKRPTGYIALMYRHQLVQMLLRQGRLEEAETALQALEELPQTVALDKAERSLHHYFCLVHQHLLRSEQGGDEGCESFLRRVISLAGDKRTRVQMHYELGRLCLREGRDAEARAALGYAAQNGNRMHVAGQARSLLASLG